MSRKQFSLLKELFLMHNLGFDHDYVANRQPRFAKNRRILKYSVYKSRWFQFGTAHKTK
jgi:hypothetical protein